MSPSQSLHRIPLLNVNCFLIHRPGAAILVDSGNRGSEKKILDEMEKLGLSPHMLSLLVLTHVHFDHAGSAARLREVTGCRILVNAADAPRLEAGRTPFPRGTRWKAKIVVAAGRVVARPTMKFPPAKADILTEGERDLSEFGFEGKLIPVPGHTPGSQVVLLPDGNLLGGDTFFGLAGKRHFPPFAEDEEGLWRRWGELSARDFTTIHPAHGHPFKRASYTNELVASGRWHVSNWPKVDQGTG